MNIEGIGKAKILAALYNRSAPQGMGVVQAKAGQMTESEAEALLTKVTYFDYLYGKVMKIDLHPDVKELDTRLYNRDLADGAAEAIIEQLKMQGE